MLSLKCMKKVLLITATVFLLFFPLNSASLRACSLAIHDWQLVFFAKLPISAPLFPLAEFNLLQANFKELPASKILWKSGHSWLGHFLSGFVNAMPDWPAKAKWILTDENKSVISMARNLAKRGSPPVIIGSEQNFLKIAFFTDANSGNNCHQLVLMTNSRLRGIHADSDKPWAQEANTMAWTSLIFYQLPIPGRIMSLSVFPYQSTRISLFEDHNFVEDLMARKLLTRRPDLEIDPFVFDFPELPE